jgi:hypothetical protein
MHDNDGGVEAFVCFTSIPCGNDPRLSIGHFGTIAYIYKAIRVASKTAILLPEPIKLASSMRAPHTSIVSLLSWQPFLYIQPCRSSRVLYISFSRSCPPVQLNLSPFRLLNGSAASYFPFAAISSCAWVTGAGSAPPSWLGLGRSWKLGRAGRCA